MSVLLSRLTARGRAEVERLVGRALGESVGDDRIVTEPPSNGGDEERLRGIPVIGGTTGAIRGTIPGRGRKLERWERRG